MQSKVCVCEVAVEPLGAHEFEQCDQVYGLASRCARSGWYVVFGAAVLHVSAGTIGCADGGAI